MQIYEKSLTYSPTFKKIINNPCYHGFTIGLSSVSPSQSAFPPGFMAGIRLPQ